MWYPALLSACCVGNVYLLMPIYSQCVLLSRYFWSRKDLCIKYQRIVLPTLISESRETKQICTTQSLANCLAEYRCGLNPRIEKDGFARCLGILMCFPVNTLGTNSALSCTNMKISYSRISQNTYYLENCPLSFGLMTMLPCHVCFPILLYPAYLDLPEKLDLVYESRIVPSKRGYSLIKPCLCFLELYIMFILVSIQRAYKDT